MRVLDMGSGLMPDKRSTDTIEISQNLSFLRHEEQFTIKQAIDSGISPKKIAQSRDYRDKNITINIGIDFNKRIPYNNNTFDLITSMASVAAFGKINAYKEAYRILKPGGVLEISAAQLPPEWVVKIRKYMERCGFKQIHVKTGIPDTGLFRIGLKKFKKDTVYGIKP